MQNSTLIEILKKMEKDELKKFEDLVTSPYYNKKPTVVNLFKQIKKFSPSFTDERLKREIIWSQLFQGKKYNYGVMKNIIHNLQKLVEKFIELQFYESNEFAQKSNYLDALMNKQLISQFEKNIRQLKTEMKNSQLEPQDYYYKYQIETKEQNYFYHYIKLKEPGFCKPYEMSEFLSASFFINFFSDNYNSLLQSKFYNKAYDTEFIRVVFDFFEKSLSKNDIQIRMLYYSLKIVVDSCDDESFYLFKDLFKKNLKTLSSKLTYNAGLSLLNYCNFQLMIGRLLFIQDQFELCRMMVENGLYKGDDMKYFDSGMFVRVVGSACNANQTEWAARFIEEFKDQLHPEQREQNLMLALIAINIKRKNFDAALDYLSKADMSEVIQKINIKRYQIMIYYELGYINELYSLIDTTKHFISHDVKSSEEVKESFQNFVAIVLQLLSLKSNLLKRKSKPEIELLKEKIQNTEAANKLWLLQKAAELEEKY